MSASSASSLWPVVFHAPSLLSTASMYAFGDHTGAIGPTNIWYSPPNHTRSPNLRLSAISIFASKPKLCISPAIRSACARYSSPKSPTSMSTRTGSDPTDSASSAVARPWSLKYPSSSSSLRRQSAIPSGTPCVRYACPRHISSSARLGRIASIAACLTLTSSKGGSVVLKATSRPLPTSSNASIEASGFCCLNSSHSSGYS